MIRSLTKKNDVSLLLRRGKKIESPLFRLTVLPNKLLYSRIVVVVSKSVDKRAVKRNLLRRRIKEWLRKDIFFQSLRVDAVFLVKKDAASSKKTFFYEELERISKKI